MEDEVEVEAEVVAFKQGEVVAFNVAEVHPGVEVVGVAVAASGVEGDFRTRFCNIFTILLSIVIFGCIDLITMTNLC